MRIALHCLQWRFRELLQSSQWRFRPVIAGSEAISSIRSFFPAMVQMVIHHACCLHEGIANSRATKLKSPLAHIFAHSVAYAAGGRNILHRSPAVDDRMTFDKA